MGKPPEKNEVNELALLKLTTEDLKELRAIAVGHRRILLDATADPRRETSATHSCAYDEASAVRRTGFSSLFNAVGHAAINDELRVGARRHRSTEIARPARPLRPGVQSAPLTQGWPLTLAREASRLI